MKQPRQDRQVPDEKCLHPLEDVQTGDVRKNGLHNTIQFIETFTVDQTGWKNEKNSNHITKQYGATE